MPSLFSVCLGMRYSTLVWNSPCNQSCVPNKKAEAFLYLSIWIDSKLVCMDSLKYYS